MTEGGYPHQRLYVPYVHRELSVSWISQALLLSGQHRLDLGSGIVEAGQFDPSFHCLEFGCGYGLNLILNAAAHPEGRFYGVDLNPSHVAQATALAADLGVVNVVFALADLCDFTAGRPDHGPAAAWPEGFHLVLAHGVAAWVSAEVRQALVAAAAALLRPGGVFQCSYNTYPGWLGRSPLAMLCQELAQRAGGRPTRRWCVPALNASGPFWAQRLNLCPSAGRCPALALLWRSFLAGRTPTSRASSAPLTSRCMWVRCIASAPPMA